MNLQNITWTTEKPEITQECILLTATSWGDGFWYGIFEVKHMEGEDENGNPGYYYALIDDNGDEWGGYEDLEANQYALITPLKQS